MIGLSLQQHRCRALPRGAAENFVEGEDSDEAGIFDEELDGFEDFDGGIGGTAIAVNTGEALKFTLAISAKKKP